MTLSSRERTAVIIGLISVLLFLGLQYAVFPLMDQHRAMNSQMEVKASLLVQYETRLHMLPELEQQLVEYENQLHDVEEGFVDGPTPSLGAAQVQLILDKLSRETKGIGIKSTRVLDPQQVDMYTKVAVRVILDGRTKILTDFIYAIEHQPATLSVSEITIRVPNPKTPRNLRAEIVVEAIMKESPADAPISPPEKKDHVRSKTA